MELIIQDVWECGKKIRAAQKVATQHQFRGSFLDTSRSHEGCSACIPKSKEGIQVLI